jgi:glycerol-3-phosphate dehydrogenase
VESLASNLSKQIGPAWTANVPLPGGEIPDSDLDLFTRNLARRYPGMPPEWLRGLARRHGGRSERILGSAREPADLGQHYGGGLTTREVDYLVENEWAVSADDVLWRRTKAGLRVTGAARADLESYLAVKRAGRQ